MAVRGTKVIISCLSINVCNIFRSQQQTKRIKNESRRTGKLVYPYIIQSSNNRNSGIVAVWLRRTHGSKLIYKMTVDVRKIGGNSLKFDIKYMYIVRYQKASTAEITVLVAKDTVARAVVISREIEVTTLRVGMSWSSERGASSETAPASCAVTATQRMEKIAVLI